MSPRKRGGRSEKLFILHEDDAVVVLDKPAGLPAVPIKGSDLPSAWSKLSEELHRRRERAYVVHRIDRFTSGIILFAKTKQIATHLSASFSAILRSGSMAP